jgi:hypothetical protein
MKVRNALIMAGLLAVGALAAPLTGFAQPTELRIYVETAPPPAKVTAPPTEAKVGYVWSDGYWAWNGKAYEWTEGSFVQIVEPAQKWVGPTWTQENDKWYFTAGHWE